MSKIKKSPTAKAIQQSFFEEQTRVNVPQNKKVQAASWESMDASLYGFSNDNDKSFGIYMESINQCPPRIFMEDKQVVPIILNHYDSVLQQILKPEFIVDIERIKQFLKTHGVDRGICYYSRTRLGVAVHNSEWINRMIIGARVYWYDIPALCSKSQEMISCVSYRVEKLKEVIGSL